MTLYVARANKSLIYAKNKMRACLPRKVNKNWENNQTTSQSQGKCQCEHFGCVLVDRWWLRLINGPKMVSLYIWTKWFMMPCEETLQTNAKTQKIPVNFILRKLLESNSVFNVQSILVPKT